MSHTAVQTAQCMAHFQMMIGWLFQRGFILPDTQDRQGQIELTAEAAHTAITEVVGSFGGISAVFLGDSR